MSPKVTRNISVECLFELPTTKYLCNDEQNYYVIGNRNRCIGELSSLLKVEWKVVDFMPCLYISWRHLDGKAG